MKNYFIPYFEKVKWLEKNPWGIFHSIHYVYPLFYQEKTKGINEEALSSIINRGYLFVWLWFEKIKMLLPLKIRIESILFPLHFGKFSLFLLGVFELNYLMYLDI